MSDLSNRDAIDALEMLVVSDGWALVIEHARKQITSRENEILAGTLSHDRYVQAAAERAVAAGIIDYPIKTIAALRQTEETT